jgi:hypothetical protein
MNQRLLDILPLAAKGFCCSQILGLLALRAQGVENPGLVRALGGLCHGLGQCGLTCGLLTGGACVLSYFLGKGSDEELPADTADLAVSEFVDWFTERTREYGGTACADILGQRPDGKPDMSRCAALIGESWDAILTILTGLGVDPTEVRE